MDGHRRIRDLILIEPPRPYLREPHAQSPLGLLYLAAVAEENGLDVAVMSLAGRQRRGPVALPPARVYGLTGTFLDRHAIAILAVRAMRPYPDCVVIVGGPIQLGNDLMDADYIIEGEGESLVAQMLELPQHRDRSPVRLHGTPLPLDDLPFPARHLWAGPFGGSIFLGGRNYFGGGSATIITSRGCTMACSFCASQALCGGRVRFRSPASVVAEMESLAVDYGVRQFRFNDDSFTAHRQHLWGICEAILNSRVLGHGTRLAWRASCRRNPHDVAMFSTMRAAGCREISVGIETADPDVLALIATKGTVADGHACLANARRAGIRTRALLMIGLPGTEPATFIHNARFLQSGMADAVSIAQFTPLPSTPIYDHPEKFRCRLRHVTRSLCLYGPHGRNEICPAIELEAMSLADLTAQMRATVHIAEHAALKRPSKPRSGAS